MMSAAEMESLFKTFADLKIGVIGDLMLDTYWWGRTERISPEAPVPVVAVSSKEQRIGGAGNVALNVASLGAKVSVISVIGDDDEGKQLLGLLEKNNIGTGHISKSTDRHTTNKIRIISRNQHMMRLDAEMTHPLASKDEEQLINSFKIYIEKEKPQLIILEDYNKGVLTEHVIEQVISTCKEKNILTAVDPKRKNFFAYQHADIFKPNLHEAKEGLNILGDSVSEKELGQIHEAIYQKLHHKISFITLSEKGVFYESGKEKAIIPTHIRNVADVSGAGDTVIATAAVVYAASKNIRLMAEIANIAGGLVCEEVGTVAIDRDKLLAECIQLICR